jgi:GNAT superfamily N-acetyltransferase
MLIQSANDNSPINAEHFCQRFDGPSGTIRLDERIVIQANSASVAINALFSEPPIKSCVSNADFIADLIGRHPSQIKLDGVRFTRIFDYSGHVYDFHSLTGIIVSSSILIGNCRCVVIPLTREDALAKGINDDTGWEGGAAATRAEAEREAEPETVSVVSPTRLPQLQTVEIESLRFRREQVDEIRRELKQVSARLLRISQSQEDQQDVLAGIAGVPDGSDARVRVVNEEMIEVNFENQQVGIRGMRAIRKDAEGKTYIQNRLFVVESGQQKKGIGTNMVRQQISFAEEHGIDRLSTSAARARNTNGYYTWARLGYDAELPSILTNKLPRNLQGAANVSDLMKTPEGRAWWKRNGVSMHMEFDLKPGSLSRKMFDAYTQERAQRESAEPVAAGR